MLSLSIFFLKRQGNARGKGKDKRKRERQGESKKVKEERPSAKAKGKTILLILDVACKPQSQLSESSVPLSCTQNPSISFLVAI